MPSHLYWIMKVNKQFVFAKIKIREINTISLLQKNEIPKNYSFLQKMKIQKKKLYTQMPMRV